ncbi:hypothetical protein EMPS_00553 [Entomortierella parvispora]|uniref:LUD domain-containing protein n=1 Tax=Entomortierella parvispora TaxID=205924 RepID=A0A9P3H1X9_9FUNG|nr:hypothetical protein EMPS_00553 [Entomortierella parvispora]
MSAPAYPENTNIKHTYEAIIKSDAQLVAGNFEGHKYSKPASPERIAAAKAGLEANGFKVHIANGKGEAFATLKSLIPAGASLNNAHSTSLEEIGFITYLKGETPWNNVHATLLAEKDPAKQGELRRTIGSTVDYYLTSLAAVTEDGLLVHGDWSGSKVGGVAFGAANVIVLVGSNKIVKDEAEARARAFDFTLKVESARVRDVYGAPNSEFANFEVIRKVNPFNPNRIQVVIVNDALGY